MGLGLHALILAEGSSSQPTSGRSSSLSINIPLTPMSFIQGERVSLSQSRHTCAHCQKLVIDAATPSKGVNRAGDSWTEIRNTFRYTVVELLQASKDACPIFERLVTWCIDHDSWPVLRNINRSIDVHLDLIISVTSESQKPALNVKRAKVSCHWADTSESILDFEGIKQNTYVFEAESGMYGYTLSIISNDVLV